MFSSFASPRLPSVRMISLSLISVVLFYLAYFLYVGHETISSAIVSLRFQDWMVLLGSSLGNYLLRFARWQVYLLKLGHAINLFTSLLYYLAGFSLTATPGKAGETIRSLYLHHHGVRFSASLAVFFSERFLDVLMLSCFALFALALFSEYQSYFISVVALLFLMVAVFAYGNTHSMLAWCLPYIRIHLLHRLLSHLMVFLSHTKPLFGFRMLTTGMLLGSLAWLWHGVAFIYLLACFDVEVAFWAAVGVYAASLLAGAISMIPGGVGTTEAAMAFLLISLGVEKELALVIPFITRLTNMWFAVGLGSLAVLLLASRGIGPKADATQVE